MGAKTPKGAALIPKLLKYHRYATIVLPKATCEIRQRIETIKTSRSRPAARTS